MRTLSLLFLIPFAAHSQITFQRDNVDKTLIRAYENGRVINTYQQDKTDKTVTWVYDAQDRQIGTLQQDKTDKDVTYWYPVEKDEPLPALPVWDWWTIPQQIDTEPSRTVEWWDMYRQKPDQDDETEEEPDDEEPPE